jgi:CheY-like chemotaxis protein
MSDAKKILVIEDDDVARELMRRALERRGYRVVMAEDGIRGYEQAVNERPDLIVTDISMPAADGVHLVRRVRDTPEIAETPILVTTGFGSGNATFSLAQGATAYEPKPIDPESFLATIERLLAGGA